MLSYTVAGPSEILAITGWMVDDIKLAKKSFIFPGQKFCVIDLSPVNYEFQVQAMSSEKLPFILPAVFTIGPQVEDNEFLIKYTKLMSPHEKNSRHVHELVQGVIEGETRVLAASMTMEQIFKGTKEFKQEVFGKVQLELNQFGLIIYNANVKQLVDVRGHEYFSYLGQKTQMEAANQAKVDVAEAKMKGTIGAKERDGRTIQNAAKIDAETRIISTQRQGDAKKEEVKINTQVKIFEIERDAEVAKINAELATKKAAWARSAELAKVEAQKSVTIREAELQTEVEKKNAQTKTEQLKAQTLSKATVDYEIKVQEANSALYKQQKAAEAELYSNKKKAEAQKALADANFYGRKQAADAELYAKQKEAEGVATMAQAQGLYISSLLKSLNGNYAALRDYMMIKNGMFGEIAKINAEAVKGMKPKLTLWSGANGVGNGGSSAMKEISEVYSMLPPLMKTVNEQTGMLPPAWLGTLSNQSSE